MSKEKTELAFGISLVFGMVFGGWGDCSVFLGLSDGYDVLLIFRILLGVQNLVTTEILPK